MINNMYQGMVDNLESYKRHAGRQFNKAKCGERYDDAMDWMHAYNSAENQIRFLCDVHHCQRTTKAYKLSINAIINTELAVTDE